MTRIALIMPTIRPRAAATARLFLRQMLAEGADMSRVSFYFSIDPPIRPGGLRSELSGEFPEVSVREVGPEHRRDLVRWLQARGIHDAVLQALITRRGYAAARNSALLHALADGADVLVQLDDDVLPFIPTRRNPGVLEWVPSDPVAAHTRALAGGAAVSRGGYLGYVSPVVDVSEVVAESCLLALGGAVSRANEVLGEDCLLVPAGPRVLDGQDELIALASSPISVNRQVSGDEPGARRAVTFGGNLGVSADALRAGAIPPFFCPASARGEDTFFDVLLSGQTGVVDVDSPVFHDPFGFCPGLLTGAGPETLPSTVAPGPDTLARFRSAFLGWVRYGPLLLRCLRGDPMLLAEELSEIESIFRSHVDCLSLLGLEGCADAFRTAWGSMESDYEEMIRADQCWRQEIVPVVAGS